MTYRAFLAAALAGAALAAAGATAALAQAAPAPLDVSECFHSSQWNGWSSPGPGIIYIKVGNSKLFRVELVNPDQRVKQGGRFLVFSPRGSSMICRAIDLNLSLADTNGYDKPLFTKSLVRLTDEEIAAIPRKFRP